jgi:hypothetical protein
MVEKMKKQKQNHLPCPKKTDSKAGTMEKTYHCSHPNIHGVLIELVDVDCGATWLNKNGHATIKHHRPPVVVIMGIWVPFPS